MVIFISDIASQYAQTLSQLRGSEVHAISDSTIRIQIMSLMNILITLKRRWNGWAMSLIESLMPVTTSKSWWAMQSISSRPTKPMSATLPNRKSAKNEKINRRIPIETDNINIHSNTFQIFSHIKLCDFGWTANLATQHSETLWSTGTRTDLILGQVPSTKCTRPMTSRIVLVIVWSTSTTPSVRWNSRSVESFITQFWTCLDSISL